LNILLFFIFTLASYLVGSANTAIIVCKLFSLPDPRTQGSKNPGATNVLRLAGKSYALSVLLGDMLKGFLPVLIAHLLHLPVFIQASACLFAVIGHIFPLFFDFRGGKGIATGLGGLLALHFSLGVIVIVIWLLIAKIFRYSSLASVIAFLLAPFISLFTINSIDSFTPLCFMSLLVLYKHRLNISRLIAGTESKIVLRNQGTIENPEPLARIEELAELDKNENSIRKKDSAED
jgi:glycerol-3-phosphate acyltransferase PlsY